MSHLKRGRKVTYTSIEERYQQLELATLQRQTYRHKNYNSTDKRAGSTMVPNRIFVGGLTNGTTEQELRHFFSIYGEVKVVKIVKDKAGALKGFGFITFGSDEEVKKIIDSGPVLIFKDKRINIAPAFEKDNKSNYDSNHSQQQSHIMSYSSQVQQYSVPPGLSSAQPMMAPVMYTYQNGMAFFNMPINGNTSANHHQPPSSSQNSTTTESLVPSVYAPYGNQSATNMQGYSGQPIFYPNPVPQVLVQQTYPNLPVCNGNQGSKILFSVPCDAPYYSGAHHMPNVIPTPDMTYPMPIMSPYMPYMVATSDGGYQPYYDPAMENIQLVHQPLYTEQCSNPRPPSTDASVGQAQVITTNHQFVSLMSVVRNDEDKPQMYTSESQQVCLTPALSVNEPSSQSAVHQPVATNKPTSTSPPAPEKSDQSPNQLLMTQIQYNIRHPPPSINNNRPEQKDSTTQRGDTQQYLGNNNNSSIKNNNDYMKNGPKKYPETRTFYKTGPTAVAVTQPRHPNGSMVNQSFSSPFFVPNNNFRHRFPKMHYPAVPQVMLSPNYPYPGHGNVRPSNGQQLFNSRGSRYGNNNYPSNKKNYSSYKGNRINRYTPDHIDNPEVSSSEDSSRTDQLASGDMGPPPVVEGMCSDMRSMTI